jgi:excinuclease UvrABC helicase subunit UvrB
MKAEQSRITLFEAIGMAVVGLGIAAAYLVNTSKASEKPVLTYEQMTTRQLKKTMQRLVVSQNFEEAAAVRDLINARTGLERPS